MIRLDVWLTQPDGSRVQVGELACAEADAHGRYASAFRYVPSYLADSDAFPLDPVALPLTRAEFQSHQLNPPLLALEDALPDVWGRRLLVLRHGLKRGQQAEPVLLRAMGGSSLGALGFAEPGQIPDAYDGSADSVALAALADAAARLEAGGELDDASRMLLVAGSSPGGARPKALVHDETGYWIAKFGSRRDNCDVVGLEATGLALARRAGLNVPEFRVQALSDTRRALLVERFDRTAGGRRHMLSFRALLQASGHDVLGYADLITAVRRHGDAPETDVPLLYRQMVFNALLGNTDDHLKNFWLLHDTAGWRLSPAFDLLPDVGGLVEHVLCFDLTPAAPGLAKLVALGRKWGISGAAAICDEVSAALSGFAAIAADYNVPHTDIDRFASDLLRRTRP
ncbi:MAG: type II toxin-antitoxin system HipA family toxin [Thiobacillus sp.]